MTGDWGRVTDRLDTIIEQLADTNKKLQELYEVTCLCAVTLIAQSNFMAEESGESYVVERDAGIIN